MPFGTDLIFAAQDLDDFIFHVEICEDYWAPQPPSTLGALAGALILCNLSASNITIGKADERKLLCASQSSALLRRLCLRRLRAGREHHRSRLGRPGLDLRDGRVALRIRAASTSSRSSASPISTSSASGSSGCGCRPSTTMRSPPATREDRSPDPFRAQAEPRRHRLRAPLRRFPYVPNRPEQLDQDCYEAFNIQVQGLAKRFTGDARQAISSSASPAGSIRPMP